MAAIIEFIFKTCGTVGNVVACVVLLLMTALGIVIALCGRKVMTGLVMMCGMIVGILAGAMIGILVFDSFILMIVFAIIGGTLLMLLMKYFKGLGYFISISLLSFFLAYVMTSEIYATNTKVTENTLLLTDLVIAIAAGVLSTTKSKFFISLITAMSGGIITSVSVLCLFGCYFSDWKTWLIAIAVAGLGMYAQIKKYGTGWNKKLRKTKEK